jgi:hypothetical protein
MFSRDKSRQDGYCSICKICTKSYKLKYYQDNIESIRAKTRIYAKTHQAAQGIRNKKYKESHHDQVRVSENARKRRDYAINPTKYRNWHNNYLNTHPEAKIASNLRIRLLQAVVSEQKAGSAVRDLGCTIKYLKIHIASKFLEGMSWNNHGEWHIDHVVPLSKFDLTNREQFLKACHFTNLQPLWEADNLRKGNRTV